MAQDLSSVRDLVKEEQAVVLLATVALHDGETSHHEVTAEGHVAITVKTHRHGAPITALLPGGSDGATGVWWIPEIGTEVAIAFDGDYEGDAFVIAIYGSKPPSQLVEGKLVVVGTEIHAIAPNGTAVSLAKKSDVQGVSTYLQKQFHSLTGHVHATPSGPSTGITEGAGGGGSGTSGTAPNPVGTTVLKGQ